MLHLLLHPLKQNHRLQLRKKMNLKQTEDLVKHLTTLLNDA
jgi:hypothetical protein